MSRRVLLLLTTALVAFVVVVGVVLLTGGDDGSGQTVRGDAARGFPLRGSLAHDEDAIGGAVAAWRGAEDRLGADDDVTVVWIGRSRREDVAVLGGGRLVSELVRRGADWTVRATAYDGSASDAGTPVGVGDSVVVPDNDLYAWRGAAGSPEPLENDGLFAVAGTRGFLRGSPPGPADISVMWGVGIGPVGVDLQTARTLARVFAGPMAGPVWDAVRTADAALDRKGEPLRSEVRFLHVLDFDPYVNEDVVVNFGRGGYDAIAVGHPGGAQLLGAGFSPGGKGAVAAGAVRTEDHSYAVLAAVDTPSVRARIGAAKVSRPGPAAVIELPDGPLPTVDPIGTAEAVALSPRG